MRARATKNFDVVPKCHDGSRGPAQNPAAVALGRLGGPKGGTAPACPVTAENRSAIVATPVVKKFLSGGRPSPRRKGKLCQWYRMALSNFGDGGTITSGNSRPTRKGLE
jgi:hypothetical protein